MPGYHEIATVATSLIRLAAPSFIVSVAVLFLLRRIPSLVRLAPAGALATAFLVGYVVLPERAPLLPQAHWHWLPYLGIAGAAAGLIANIRFLGVWRHTATLIATCCAAWLLVPTWAELAPSRPLLVTGLTVYLVAISLVLVPLAERISSRESLTYLCMVWIAIAVCAAAVVSVRYGQIAGVGAASVAGLCVASWLTSVEPEEVLPMIPCFAILAGGISFVAFIEPDPPLYQLLLIPFVPATLWVLHIQPLGRLKGAKATAVRSGLVVIMLAITCGLALI